jgi:DNA polymerase III subunit epsilon
MMDSDSLIASLGARLKPAESSVTDAAVALIGRGPISSPDLVAQVCQAIGVRRSLAESLARAILGHRPDVRQGPDGNWRVSGVDVAVPPLAAPLRDGEARKVRSRSGEERIPLSSLRFAVVDVETTGGRPSHGDRITEIAVVRMAGGEIVDVFESLVNPKVAIPPMISRLTRITNEMVREQPVFADVAQDVASRLEGHIFVAHNASFDWKFVSHEVFRATGQALEGETLCTVKLARKFLPQLPRRNLDAVAHHYGVEIPEHARHRAAGDAIATAKILQRLLRDAAAQDVTTWGELAAYQRSGTSFKKRKRARATPTPVRDASDGA